MVKRKCGTCLHFKDGGIAGSGWCQHPARRDLQHMVFVRKSELACRNGWDQDLWQLAREAHDAATTTQSPGTPAVGLPVQSLYTMEADDDGNLVPPPDELFTDRLTSITMAAPAATTGMLNQRHLEPPSHGVIDQEMVAALDARNAVREARRRRQEQRNQEKASHQRVVLEESGRLLGMGDGQDSSAVDPILGRNLATRRPEASLEASAHRPMLSMTPGDGPVVPQGPAPRSERRPSTDRTQTEIGRGNRGPSPSIEYTARPDRFRGSGGDGDSPTTVPGASAPPHPAPQRRVQHGTAPLPQLDPSRGSRPDAAIRPPEVIRPTRAPSPGKRSSEPLTPDAGPSSAPAASVLSPHTATGARSGGGVIASPSTRQSTRLASAFPVDPIDSAAHLSTVPRCCGTCRDFKQSGDSGRGWCSYPHAFDERRMVESSDLACRSSLGVWWLPHDDLWLERADTTHHGRPTPLLDELMREKLSDI